MIERNEIVEAGKFQKTHALKGELNMLFDMPVEYVEDGNPLIVETDGIFVPYYAESIRPKGATSFLVKLEGVDSQEDARDLVNAEIYVPKDKVAEYMDAEGEEIFFGDDLSGYSVIDVALGKIGEVERIDDSTENVLLIIETEQGDEVMVPFVDSFIKDVDEDLRVINTDLPEGLLELNIKNGD